MSRPTPETDAALYPINGVDIVWPEFARQLERELDEAREQTAMWKANHDNQVALKAMLMDRPDLGDRAFRIAELIRELDEAREALEFRRGLFKVQEELFENSRSECDELRKAIKNFYKAKGRHNSQIAAARMFELVGLPAEYPQVKAPK